MHPTNRRTEMWLYPGEFAVFDIGMWWNEAERFNFSGDRRKYEMMVFVDLEPVEFAMLPVDADPEKESFPDLEEIEQLEDFERSVPFDLHKDEPEAFTVVIPPSSFGEAGAKDVRIIFATRGDLGDGSDITERHGRGFDMVVNYGGTTLQTETEFPDLQYELTHPRDSWDRHLWHTGTLIMPPDPLEQIDDEFMTKPHYVSDNEVTLDLWQAGARRGEDWPMLLLPLDGTTVLDEPRGMVRLPQPPAESIEIRDDRPDYAARFDFTAPVSDDETHRFRMAILPSPFCREALTQGLGTTAGTRLSHTVFVRSE